VAHVGIFPRDFSRLEIFRPASRFAFVDTFIQCFVREGDGAWRCTRPAELQVEVGRIQVAPGTTFTKGTTFMGIDLASLLEDYHQTSGARV